MIPMQFRRPSRRSVRTVAVRTVSVFVSALSLSTVVTACGGDADGDTTRAASSPAASPAYGPVSADDARALAAAGVTVIDVRTPDEYAEGHIDGARLIDFYDPTFVDQLSQLDPDEEYLVYCRSGNRSGQAVDIMADLGIDRTWDLAGGVLAYDSADLVPTP